MTIPRSERTSFKNNPLEEVVFQLDFPDILAITSQDPATFQDRIRSDYPLYERQEDQRFPEDFGRIFASLSIQGPRAESAHHFGSEDGTRTISLFRNKIALTDHKYETWERFRQEIRLAVKALEDSYNPSSYSRIGLRYRDVVNPSKLSLEGVPWHELVHPWLLGIAGRDEIREQVVAATSTCRVQLETVTDSQSAVNLRHGVVRLEGGENGYAIDADFFSEGRFDSQQSEVLLNEFNTAAGDLFRWCITDKLKAALEPTERPSG